MGVAAILHEEGIDMRQDEFLIGDVSQITHMAPITTGSTTRRVETPADRSGNSSLLRCMRATLNMAASRTMASEMRSKILAEL